MGRPPHVHTPLLSDQDVVTVKKDLNQSSTLYRIGRRERVLLLLHQGHSISEVARFSGMQRRHIVSLMEDYRTGGLLAVKGRIYRRKARRAG